MSHEKILRRPRPNGAIDPSALIWGEAWGVSCPKPLRLWTGFRLSAHVRKYGGGVKMVVLSGG